jgi:glycosyltransferase involved in cell wall biosynthesis
LDIVLPCLDEAGALPRVLAQLPAGVRAVVVDNGSTDGSAELARRLGATVVTAPVRGYGSACAAGLAAVLAPVVAFCDCDASVDLAEVVAAAAAVRDGSVDLVSGRRRPRGRGAWPVHARIAVSVLAWLIRRRSGLGLRDLGPVRIMRTAAVRDLDVRDRRSGYPLETVLRAAAAGWRIEEVPLAYTPRVGRSKVTGTLAGTVRAIRDMSAVLARSAAPARAAEPQAAR